MTENVESLLGGSGEGSTGTYNPANPWDAMNAFLKNLLFDYPTNMMNMGADVLGNVYKGTVFELPTTAAGVIAEVVQGPPLSTFPDILPDLLGGGGGGNGVKSKNRFLPYLLGGMAAVVCAPIAYNAFFRPKKGKRAKDGDNVAQSLDLASSRATTLITAFAPVVALPVAYIAVDELENRKIISGALGDDVQLLMTAMASGSLLSGVAGIVKAVV